MTNRIKPESACDSEEEPQETREEALTEDEYSPDDQPSSTLQRMKRSMYSWINGQKPRKLDMEDIEDARGVTSFAKEYLMPALYKASTSQSTMLGIKLSVFIGLNALLVGVLFVYTRSHTYNYLTGGLQMVDGIMIYKLDQSSTYGRVALMTDDVWDKPPPDGNAEELAQYEWPVMLLSNEPRDPGWILQDILDLPRTVDADLAYSNAALGGRLVQDYRRCSTACLDDSSHPTDLSSRDTTMTPYGQFGDFYVRRDLVLAAIDPDFYQQFLNASMTAELRASKGNFGFDRAAVSANANVQSMLSETVPSDSGYLCNLGKPRKRLEAIRVLSKACYVQVVSAPGDGYQLYTRTHTKAQVAASVSQTEITNPESGCSTYTLDITAQAETCKRPQLVQVDPGCETSCAVVLFKGVNARHVPIHVVESRVAGPWPSTLHINDKHLVLPELNVDGGSIAINISGARIRSLAVSNVEGTISLNHVRVDSVVANSTTDNVIIEDDRDTELQYRSGGNLLCAAAPLVEAIPDTFMGCNTTTGRPAPHAWYESTQDGFIDRDEFAAGLARLGLSYAPASLNLDETEQAQLLEVMFKDDAAGAASDRVTLDVFDANLQQVKGLDSMAESYQLLDPWCYSGRFLKVRPAYIANVQDTADKISAAAMELDSSRTVLDTRMPLYPKSASAPADINPCPPEWGTGMQSSTTYSHFTWANSSIGFKWGKALPVWCLDEAWPGMYPENSRVYGSMAGQAVLPGCEPSTCKPLYRVMTETGSIHVQVLPFTHDAWNATGMYQTMVSNCQDSDGQLRCFYKGWADDMDASLHPKDQADWQTRMDPCYADSMDCSDTVQAVTVAGHGSPLHQKWFWSSRKVYLELEPAWYLIMSAALLKPDVNPVSLRLSPGYCNAQLGAVEHIDWRHSDEYDTLLGSADALAAGVTKLSDESLKAQKDARDSKLAQQGIRATRGKHIYDRIVSTVNGTMPDRSGWFLKQSIRQDYRNETLMLSPVTVDGNLDTNPGHVDAAGKLHDQGPWFRHKRVCLEGKHCQYGYMVYRDNCKVQRTAALDPSSKQPALSACVFADGSSAYEDTMLMEAGPTFNETAYYAQFPLPVQLYSLASVHQLTGDDLLQQAQLADYNTHAWDNVTETEHSKWLLQEAENGDLQLQDATNSWKSHKPLFGAIVLSIVIAVLCSILVVAMLVFKGLGVLKRTNQDLQARAKIELAVLEERKAAMFAEVLERKRFMVLQARVRGAAHRASQLDQNLLPIGDSSSGAKADVQGTVRLPALSAHGCARTSERAANTEIKRINADDVFLTDAEKAEILRVWGQKGFPEANFRSWDKAGLLKAWEEEVFERSLSADNPTLLPENAPQDGAHISKLTSMMVKNGFILRRPKVDITIKDAGPFKPARNRTLDATELAADPVKLHKLESKLRYEEIMNKLQKQVSSNSRRGSKEQQKLLGPSSTTQPQQTAKTDHILDTWISKAGLIAAIYAERSRRLLEKLVQMCMISLPSPFQVINNAVVGLFQSLWVDSLETFLNVKCLFDHDMAVKEEMLLGNCEQARRDLSTQGARPNARPSAAGGKSAEGSKPSSHAVGEAGPQIEVDGEGDVMACEAVNGKKEIYRTKYVRVTLQHKMITMPRSEAGSDYDDTDVDEGPFSGSHDSATCAVTIGTVNTISGGFMAFSKSIGKSFAHAKAALASEEEAKGVAKTLTKRVRQWEVCIEEGPGVVSSSTYKPEVEPMLLVPNNASSSGGAAASSSLSGGSNVLRRRILVIPCASKKELQQAADHELVVDAAVRVRHYMVRVKAGRCVVSINTLPNAAASGSKDWLPGGQYMAPRVSFSMPLTTFTPEYETFCMQNELRTKDVLSPTAVLGRFNISMKKRLMSAIKGLKQKAANVDSPEELTAMAQDSVLCVPGSTAAQYDADEDMPKASTPVPDNRNSGRLPPLQPGAVPSFPGASAVVCCTRELHDKLVHSAAGSEQQRQPLLACHSDCSTIMMEGNSSDDEDADQVAPLAAMRRLTGLDVKPASRRTTGTVPTTQAEAKEANRKVDKRPAAKLQMLLESSNEPLAAFLRETYEVTANFVSDEVELEIMQRQFRRWNRAKKAPKPVSLSGGPTSKAVAFMLGAAVPPLSVFPKQYPSGEEVAAYGFNYQQQPEHTMFGVLVNQQDYSDDPRDANRSVYLAAELVSVVMHTVFIWILPMPLFIIAFGFQGYYNATTSIQPVVTFDEFRLNPLACMRLDFIPLIKAMVLGGMVWVLFCYAKLLAHYLLTAYEDRPWRAVVKTLFWAYLTVMVSVLVAYAFEVFCWVILGAVINPNKFLPYSVAAITLVAHSKATWGRLINKFNNYRASLSSSVMKAFAQKIQTAEQTTAQTAALLQEKLTEVGERVREAASLSGGTGDDREEESTNHSAIAGMMGGAMSAVGMGMMGVVAGSALTSRTGRHTVWPGLRRSSAGNNDEDHECKGTGSPARDAGSPGLQQQASNTAPSQQGSKVFGAAACSMSGSNACAKQPAAAAAPAAAGSSGEGGSKGDALECYKMFQMFASGDDSLNYSEFCALLEHLDIRLLEHKRRKLFAHIDKSADGRIGYQEFQEGFQLLKEQIVERHMAKAGITMGRLLFLLAYAIVILLLMFVFIFLGVAAFTGANTMGAVVNSCMTAGAGLAMNLKGEEDEDEEEEDVDISDA